MYEAVVLPAPLQPDMMYILGIWVLLFFVCYAISEQGEVSVYYYCSGDASTVSVKVTILIEKRTLLLFWKDVQEWTINGSTSVQGVKNYSLTDSGTYRCTIVYEVTSTDGTVETQEYEKQIKYDPA